MKQQLKRLLPRQAVTLLKFIAVKDYSAFIEFLNNRSIRLSRHEKMKYLRRIFSISNKVESPHTQQEILSFATTILTLPPSVPGKVVEAGCFKGSSTSKFSIAAKLAGRELLVFDSFEGIPENDEKHEKNIFGGGAKFDKGDWAGQLEEVKGNVRKYGEISCATFIKGWFDDTMPHLKDTLAAVYIDVDLASSTKTCLKYCWPLLSSGGVAYSQDGHLPLVLEAINDDNFWEKEIGVKKPVIEGFGTSKLLRMVKP